MGRRRREIRRGAEIAVIPGKDAAFRVLPARNGLGWLTQSLLLLRSQAGRLLLIAVMLQFIMSLTQLPIAGLLVVIAVPALSAGMLEAFHQVSKGGAPRLSTLLLPLASNEHRGRLLMLGALLFIVGLVSVSLVLSGSEELFDPELLARVEQGDIEALTQLDPATVQQLALALVIGISVSGTLSYFSVPLIWFHQMRLGPAIGLGLKALFANWRPFLALGLLLALLLIPGSMAAAWLFSVSGAGGGSSIIIVGLVMILMLALQLIIFGTQYCAVRDIFGIGDGEEAEQGTDDGQLLA
jgi:hypothetical protein